jgi:AcrR family transcriptional regulator
VTARPAPGRDQLVGAALSLIGERGVRAATVRAVAERAGVTPGLVVHHFGTKQALVDEVEQVVVDRLAGALAVPGDAADAAAAAAAISEQLSRTIGTDHDLRRYVRRAMLEASPAGEAILRRIVERTVAALRRFAGELRLPADADVDWLAMQVVAVNLAATLFEPLLGPVLGRDPFSPAEVAGRTEANLRFLSSALGHLHGGGSAEP